MLKTIKNVLAALVLLLIFISASFAQQANSSTHAKVRRRFRHRKGFQE